MSKNWYAFTGTDSEAYTLNKYRYRPIFPGGCDPGKHICSVYALYGGDNPDTLSARVQNYIAAALSNGTNQPTSGKKYVYTKSV